MSPLPGIRDLPTSAVSRWVRSIVIRAWTFNLALSLDPWAGVPTVVVSGRVSLRIPF
jgi:hypothetical protein